MSITESTVRRQASRQGWRVWKPRRADHKAHHGDVVLVDLATNGIGPGFCDLATAKAWLDGQ